MFENTLNAMENLIKTIKGIGKALTIKTGKAIYASVKDVVINDIINGNTNTRSKLTGKAVLELGVSIIGAKALDKTLKAVKFSGAGRLSNYVDEIGRYSDDVIKQTGKAGADNIANSAKLNSYYKQAEKYGTGSIKELSDGRYRFYGELKPALKKGEMAGDRLVREWNPAIDVKRTWYETLDHAGNIRQVRPDPKLTNGFKTHYMFDANGNYTGSWIPQK